MSAPDFCGSYQEGDVVFLLKPVKTPFIDIEEKEALIQSGKRHYSEMLSLERPPSPAYMEAFRTAFEANRERVGRDIASLAKRLAERQGEEVALVSLARAGTPIGVLLRRALSLLGRTAPHYSVSIIRDRGLDLNAMKTILARHHPQNIVFIDGWTGKGAITTELRRSIADNLPVLKDAPLVVLSDLAGCADLAAGCDDYVIPSAILNGVISGLISRTILSDDLVGPNDYHGVEILDHLAGQDISRWYVDEQMKDVVRALDDAKPARWDPEQRDLAARTSQISTQSVMERTGIADRNRIKPGIGESTRALLRRMPDRLFIQNSEKPDIKHLLALARERGIEPEIDPDLAYSAVTVIKTMGER